MPRQSLDAPDNLPKQALRQNIDAGLRWLANLVQARYYIVVRRDAFFAGGRMGAPAAM